MRILYIDCDSLRPDHLGCYGYDRDTSPAIDGIAATERRFTNYYVSDAPCLPSRTAYFTGRFGIHTGVVNHSGINADVRHRGAARGTSTGGRYRTLPRSLRNAGYRTAFVSPFPQRHGAADLAGDGVPAGWDGESFAPALTDGASEGREFLVTGQGAWACQRGVRFDDWLLLRTYHDGWKEFEAVELYDLDSDPHETENVAPQNPEVAERGMALLNRWRGQRGINAATGANGGNPDAPRTLVDPLFEVIHEGGPTYLRGNVDVYTERLRETGRTDHAEEIERRDGVVRQDTAEFN